MPTPAASINTNMQEQSGSSLNRNSMSNPVPWLSSTSPPEYMDFVFEGLTEVCAQVLDHSCEKTFTACDVWQEIYTNTNLCAQASEYLLRDEKGRFYDGEGEEMESIDLDFEHIVILLDSLVENNRAKIVSGNSSMKVYKSLEEEDSDDDSSSSSSSGSDEGSSSACDR